MTVRPASQHVKLHHRTSSNSSMRVLTKAQLEKLVEGEIPYYRTMLGAAYLGDALHLLSKVRRSSVQLILTSPPFALTRPKRYGSYFDRIDPDSYIDWFMRFSSQMYEVLGPDGSLVIHLGGTWVRGRPLKSLYHYKLAVELCEKTRFRLAQDFYWANRAKLPTPAEWVTVRRIRVKDAVDPVWWFCKDQEGKTRASNRRVLQPYSKKMKELLRRGYYNSGRRPSGHDISKSAFLKRNRGSIPPNLLTFPATESNSPYLRYCRQYRIEVNPARYPVALADFFVRFLTRKGDLILDPFAGSNATGEAAERLGRRWLAFEIHEPYLNGSRFRFFSPEQLGFKPSKEFPAPVPRMS